MQCNVQLGGRYGVPGCDGFSLRYLVLGGLRKGDAGKKSVLYDGVGERVQGEEVEAYREGM
jgi:hypothetical protein